MLLAILMPLFVQSPACGEPPSDDPTRQQAELLVSQVIERLSWGETFTCRLRQRVHTSGREVSGIGSLIQVGRGTGQFDFSITLHDGNDEHRLRQISDGRLTWTRSVIAETVSLSRVDVGSLDEGARTMRQQRRIKPSMLVGGLCETLDTMRSEYDLKLGTSHLDGRALLVVIGDLKESRRQQLQAKYGDASWPESYPTRVNLAIAQDDDPATGLGKGLPVRIEHFSDPVALSTDPRKKLESQLKSRKMISMLELYDIVPIKAPPIEQFRAENEDTTVDFVNETARYENRFGISLSAKQRARFR